MAFHTRQFPYEMRNIKIHHVHANYIRFRICSSNCWAGDINFSIFTDKYKNWSTAFQSGNAKENTVIIFIYISVVSRFFGYRSNRDISLSSSLFLSSTPLSQSSLSSSWSLSPTASEVRLHPMRVVLPGHNIFVLKGHNIFVLLGHNI